MKLSHFLICKALKKNALKWWFFKGDLLKFLLTNQAYSELYFNLKASGWLISMRPFRAMNKHFCLLKMAEFGLFFKVYFTFKLAFFLKV